MLTRGEVTHQYFPAPVGRVSQPGAVRLVKGTGPQKNIVQTWAITRPNSSPATNGAPFYVNGYQQNSMQFGGVMPLRMTPPRLQMDPSDPSTWQREYVFTR